MGCAICSRFSTLYDQLAAADTEWAALQDKRDTLTKLSARKTHKKAHMEFDNWLMTVEATPNSKEMENYQEDTAEQASAEVDEEQHQGIKRRRSHSPSTQQSGETKAQNNIPGSSPHQLPLRPSPKRSRSTTSLPERKRLKFSDSVQFHDNYRSSGEYHRPSDTYVRGRNAPPEDAEYMDTSGSGQSFLKFTRTKKVGAKWVEVSEEELAKKSEDAKVSAELRRLGVAQKSAAEEGDEDAAGDLKQKENAPPDARATRLARRAKGASSVDLTQKKSTRAARSGKLSRGSREESLDRALDETQKPNRLGPISSTLRASAADTLLAGQSGAAQDDVVAYRTVQGHNIEKAPEVAILEAMRDRQVLESNMTREDSSVANSNTTMLRNQKEPIDVYAVHSKNELDPATENKTQRDEPKNEATCIAWEDAYMASSTRTVGPANMVQLSEHKNVVAISPIEEERKIASLPEGYSSPLQSSKTNNPLNGIPQPPEIPLGSGVTSGEDTITIHQPLQHSSAESASHIPQVPHKLDPTSSPDTHLPTATVTEPHKGSDLEP
jgi:hypothetical protein